MSKRFQGKSCVYCSANPSTTADHVFARNFFPEPERANLPKVPACNACNHEKSRLEHYLTAVLPFGGRHGDASELLQLVPSKLAKNVRLHRELEEGIDLVLSEELPGLFAPTIAIPFDDLQLHQLFGFITKGLLWHHWSVILTTDHDLRAFSLSNLGEAFISQQLDHRAKKRVNCSVGNGAFSYEGAQGNDYPEFSVWRFSIFGGLKLAGDPTLLVEEYTSIGVITAQRQFLERLAISGG